MNRTSLDRFSHTFSIAFVVTSGDNVTTEDIDVGNATVGIREFKARLSSYLRRVQEGEAVTITDRGEPIGQIVPMKKLPTAASRVLALTQSGIIAWNGQKLRANSPRIRVRGKHTVAELLLVNRE